MPTSLRIAGAQMPVTRDAGRNLATILRAVDFATSEKADVLLTPEGSLSGYTHEFDAAAVRDAVATIVRQASAAGVALALGTCYVEADDGACYNQIRFYEKSGAFLGCHTKTLRCGSLEDPPKGEIEHYGVQPLRTFNLCGTTVGGLICNDLWGNPCCTPVPDPHLTQQLARMGARVIFHAVNGGRNAGETARVAWHYHESNLQLRAMAARVWIVTVDNCDPPEMPCSAPCGVVDPTGLWAFRTRPQGERFFAYTIPIA